MSPLTVVPPYDQVTSSPLSHQQQPLASLEMNREEENTIKKGDKN